MSQLLSDFHRFGSDFVASLRPERQAIPFYAASISRYLFASRFLNGGDVLDAASSDGYGSRLLHHAGAKSVLGVDLEPPDGVAEGPVRFAKADLTEPLPYEGQFDLAVSLETYEHLPAEKGKVFVASLARALKPEGTLVLSTPNRRVFSAISKSPDHVNEPDPIELQRVLSAHFGEITWYMQTTTPEQAAWLRRRPFFMAARALVPPFMRARLRARMTPPPAPVPLLEDCLPRWEIVPAPTLSERRQALIQIAVCRAPRR